MRMNSARVCLNKIVIVMMLALGAGCAQQRVNLADEKLSDAAQPLTIQTVSVAPDGSQVDISVSQPGTFTFYKTTDPAKAVVDLADTEPGNFKSLDVNSGVIQRIDATKHVFSGGYLTRVEISLAKDVEFTVGVDPVDKNKLVVKFPVHTQETAAVPQLEKPVAPAPESAPQQPQATAAQPAVPSPATVVPVQPAVNSLQPRTVTAVNVVRNGIEIDVAGGVDTFNAFKMTKPDRIVVDVFGAKTSIANNMVAINAFGVGKARIGLSAEKVRVVFDAVSGTLAPYEVTKTDRGLKVAIGETANAAVYTGGTTEVSAPAGKKESAGSMHDNGPASVEAIDFNVQDGISRITIKVSGACTAGKPVKSPKGLSLSIAGCQIPRNLQRTLDTSSFVSTVLKITPYQAKVKSGYDTRLMVKLRADASSEVRQAGNVITWDIKNEGISEATLISEVAKSQPPVLSSATAEPVTITEKSLHKSGSDKKVYNGRRVTLEFSDADVRKIFQLIAEVSNLNFLIADDVTGTISIKLVNVPWDHALDVILETKGLEMKRDGNIVQIKPKGKFKTQEQEDAELKKERERRMELQTVVFDINYSTVEDVATQLKSVATQRDGVSISADKRTNRVIVTDIAPAIERMRFLLKNLDIPEKQVMIEARIVEASSSFTRDLGVQWGIHYKDGSASVLGINQLDTGFGGVVTPPPSSGFPAADSPGGAIGMSFGKLTSNIQIDMRLSAAAAAGLIKIVSTPKVVTLNNKAAKISQGQSIPYQTVSAEGTKTEFVEAALTLEVTPHITADGSVSMKIKASNNSAGVGSPPPINKKEATTEMQVKNGETTVIGGIYVDSDTSNDQGVPYLSDIPLIGWLFKSNTTTKTKTELLIFITPKIVS
ncbi:type IV pilus secretin family protein [Geomobilimonas luticola]|uniref:Type IV pilus secretin PilQ n=1 Tax=Geomobilimonas luticola TaxID=1114878 RepID=A0ABS5SDW6_9BACT|nr:type IV pilus secretin family protein [Geomobilimonas luticola]MBT0652832.1 type IV pilus secretin PilQ [Geomobilimonas luticola]